MKLKTVISIKIFNELCDSTFSFFHNENEIFTEEVNKNKVKEIFFDSDLDFDSFGNHKFIFNWNSKDDCANKWFEFDKIIVNGHNLPIHTVRVMPYENSYITELCSTEQGQKKFKQTTMYPGSRHGWYGNHEIDFDVGDMAYFKKLSVYSLSSYIGIKKNRIYI